MEKNIIEAIEKMRNTGKLDTEQSVDLILQLLVGLYQGQQDIMEILVKRETEIQDLDMRTINLEEKVGSMEVKINSLELAIAALSETIKINNGTIENMRQDIKSNETLTNEIKVHTIWYWAKGNKTLMSIIIAILVILINFHENVYKFALALLGIKIP